MKILNHQKNQDDAYVYLYLRQYDDQTNKNAKYDRLYRFPHQTRYVFSRSLNHKSVANNGSKNIPSGHSVLPFPLKFNCILLIFDERGRCNTSEPLNIAGCCEEASL